MQVRVARLNPAGTDWVEIEGGPSPINAEPSRSAVRPTLAGVGGVPHVAWTEHDGTNAEVRVARLNAAGTHFQEIVGGAGPINKGDGNNAGSMVGLTDVGGVPHVAWVEYDGANGEVRVAKPNGAGTAWEEVVGGDSPINASPTADAGGLDLTTIGGVPYVAWAEDGANASRQIRVARLNQAGTEWVDVVSGSSPVNASPTGFADRPSITAVGGVPHIAWQEWDGKRYQIRVARLDAAGSDWHEIVGGPSPINHASTGTPEQPDLVGVGGVPFVAWLEGDGSANQVRVARPDAAEETWREVVGGVRPINASAGSNAESPAIVQVGGVPYVSRSDYDGVTSQARVSRLEPDFGAAQAMPTTNGAVLLQKVRSYGVELPLRFEHGPGAGFGTTGPMLTTGSEQTDTLIHHVGGLTPATGYSWRTFGWDGLRRSGTGPTATFTTAAAPGTGPAGPQGPTGQDGADGRNGTDGRDGAPGPAGADGQPGLPGPVGPSGGPADRLFVALASPAPRLRAGKRVALTYIATTSAAVTLEVRRGSRVVARVVGTAKPGRNRLTWNGKAKRGTYRLELKATTAGGQVATDRATVKLR